MNPWVRYGLWIAAGIIIAWWLGRKTKECPPCG